MSEFELVRKKSRRTLCRVSMVQSGAAGGDLPVLDVSSSSLSGAEDHCDLHTDHLNGNDQLRDVCGFTFIFIYIFISFV